jgi:hypothetical protein
MLGKERLGRALPRVSGSNAVASIVTSAGTGYLMDAASPIAVFLAAAGLGLLAIVLVQGLARARRAGLPAQTEPAWPSPDMNLPVRSAVTSPTGGC